MSDIRGVVNQQTTPAAVASNSFTGVRARPDGSLIVNDWITQLALDGKVYSIQLGSESAPIASTTTIADTLVWSLIDVPASKVVIPLEVRINVANFTTATAIEIMLEVDNAANRYTSGGTAYTPLNFRTDDDTASGVTAYVGTDITAAAKTSGGSIEFGRSNIGEDAIGTATGAERADYLWSARTSIPPILHGTSSFLVHFGAATADVNGYGSILFAELSTNEFQL